MSIVMKKLLVDAIKRDMRPCCGNGMKTDGITVTSMPARSFVSIAAIASASRCHLESIFAKIDDVAKILAQWRGYGYFTFAICAKHGTDPAAPPLSNQLLSAYFVDGYVT